MLLTAEQRPVQAEGLRQLLYLSDPLVHGPGEVVRVVQAPQNDAGEVDGLSEVTHQRPLEPNHVPPDRDSKQLCSRITVFFVFCFPGKNQRKILV